MSRSAETRPYRLCPAMRRNQVAKLGGSLLAVSLLLACSGGSRSTVADASMDADGVDLAPAPPPWPHVFPPAADLEAPRGLVEQRLILHLHSPLSHDACDGAGWVDGRLADEACLAHLRAAVCDLRLDGAHLTDHAEHIHEVTHESKFWAAPGDEVVRDGEGAVVAVRWRCADGRPGPYVTVGAENALMPVMMSRHPIETVDPEQLRTTYRADGPEAVGRFRATGALVYQAHTEGRDLDELRALDLDGVEIYNLHANVDPRIRPMHLGLEPLSYLPRVLPFSARGSSLEVDLAWLGFFSENGNALAKWDTLLFEGRRLLGINGCDAHENAFPAIASDGERLDSYRRMMSWATLHVRSPVGHLQGQREALEARRGFVVFEVLGSPVGFDFHADTGEGGAPRIREIGDEAPVGSKLVLVAPRLHESTPVADGLEPLFVLRILRAAPGGAVEVARAETGGLAGTGVLEYTPTQPGAYRAEVRMVPTHARPYVGRLADEIIQEVVWIYASPVYVVAP